MEKIHLHDLDFRPYILSHTIQHRVKEMAEKMNDDLKNERPIFMGILNGAFMFVADLLKEVNMECEVTFVKLASYQGTSSTGNVKTLIGLDKNITGRTVVITEDIIDTGRTLHEFLPVLQGYQPKKILIATLLLKREALEFQFEIDYAGFEVPNEFLVGYGLDYDGLGRNLKDIFVKT